MKCQIPQISWHSRDPVLSVDFQPVQGDLYRLASGGTDSHVLIWYVTYQENKSVKVECACDLYRHNKSVNVVRFSPNGQFLASGDDEGAMFLWEMTERDQIELPKDEENINKEEWLPAKLLRGHLEDIYDISWSKDGNFLVTASMDNTLIVWDMQKYVKIHMFSDFKGYLQGVTWDPNNQYIASIGSDRTLRIHNINSKRTICKVIKAPWTISSERGNIKARLFYDDTLKSYFRRLTFTPDGEFLIVPSGIVDKGENICNTTYIFSRHAPNKPVISLPTGDKYTVAVRCNPFLYKLRGTQDDDKENDLPKPMIDLPYRMIFAVAACDSVLMYDTEQFLPFAYISNIHYTHLTDLSWSPDGLTLVASSTDGYCSFIVFTKEELGEIYMPEEPKEISVSQDDVVDQCQPLDVLPIVQDQSSEMSENISSTPKCTSPLNSKSPKADVVPVHDPKDQNATTPKVVKIIENKKSKKSPKMISIKNFFVSPKPSSSVISKNNQDEEYMHDNSEVNDTVLQDKTLVTKIESCDEKYMGTRPMSVVQKSEQSINVSKNVEEAMDIEEIPVHDVPGKTATNFEPGSTKQSKCIVQLDFTEKVSSVKHIDENALDVDISSASSLGGENVNKNIEDSESDWKLELSQDEGIVPMEITSDVVNDHYKASSSATEKPNKDSKCTKTLETSKRRIAFVTLSSKSTLKK